MLPSEAMGAPVELRARPGRSGGAPASPVCRAAHGSMYFDTRGKVRACCQNRGGYLGDVTTQTLREIWDGAEAEEMRRTLAEGRFPSACSFCAWQVRERDDDVLFARSFEHLPEPAPRRWPAQMEFALSNTCNLQCVMCSGDYSSAIRSRREGRPPMPEVYHERFFAELEAFLPHLDHAKFYGGEPLLGREPLRVLEMLAELAAPPQVVITANGTIRSRRVEDLLRRLRPHVVVSLDGLSAGSFDRIRVGARVDDVLDSILRYRELLGPGRLSLATCLMVENHHEFVDLLALSSSWGVDIGVNVVHHPLPNSLYHLPAAQLAAVVDGLEQRRAEVPADRRELFEGHLASLRTRAEGLARRDPAVVAGHDLPIAQYLVHADRTSRWGWLPFAELVADRLPPEEPPPPARGLDVEVGVDGVVQVVDGPLVPPGLGGLDGSPVEDLQDAIILRYGALEGWAHLRGPGEPEHLRVRPGGVEDPSLELAIIARRDAEGRLLGARYRLELDGTGMLRFAHRPGLG